MSTDFPTALDTLTNPTGNDSVTTVSHAAQHANANDAIEALEAKVGINGSLVQTSHDYKLGEVTGADKAVGKTATQTMTNKTLTSPTINTPTINTPVIDGGSHDDATFDNPTLTGGVEIDLGSDATGDMYYRDASGNFVRLPRGTDGEYLQLVAGLPSWEPLTSSPTLFGAYLASDVTITNTAAKVTFGTEEFDTASAHASGTFTVPSDGYYRINAHIDAFISSGGASTDPLTLYIYKNGSEVARTINYTANGENQQIILDKILSLVATDTIEIYIQKASGIGSAVAKSGSTRSFLNIAKL